MIAFSSIAKAVGNRNTKLSKDLFADSYGLAVECRSEMLCAWFEGIGSRDEPAATTDIISAMTLMPENSAVVEAGVDLLLVSLIKSKRTDIWQPLVSTCSRFTQLHPVLLKV